MRILRSVPGVVEFPTLRSPTALARPPRVWQTMGRRGRLGAPLAPEILMTGPGCPAGYTAWVADCPGDQFCQPPVTNEYDGTQVYQPVNVCVLTDSPFTPPGVPAAPAAQGSSGGFPIGPVVLLGAGATAVTLGAGVLAARRRRPKLRGLRGIDTRTVSGALVGAGVLAAAAAGVWYWVASNTIADVDPTTIDSVDPGAALSSSFAPPGLRPGAAAAVSKILAMRPNLIVTSGARTTADQARAMAENIVKSNRRWIAQTYCSAIIQSSCQVVRDALQSWVDANPQAKDVASLSAGLLSVLNSFSPDDLFNFSRHLSGDAADFAATGDPDDEAAIASVVAEHRSLGGSAKFLTKEGTPPVYVYHTQFSPDVQVTPYDAGQMVAAA